MPPSRLEKQIEIRDLLAQIFPDDDPECAVPSAFATEGSARKNPALLMIAQNEALAESLRTSSLGTDPTSLLCRTIAFRVRADKFFGEKQFRLAEKDYVEAATTLCGAIPCREKYHCERYLQLENDERNVQATLACVGVAKCKYEMGDLEGALDWIAQVNLLQRHMQASCIAPMFEWMDYHTNSVDSWRVRLDAHKLASAIYTKLGNTGAAVEQFWALIVTQRIIPEVFATEATKGFTPLSDYNEDKVLSQRHPDPALTHKHSVTVPSLQIQGSWKKLNTQGLSPRMFCSHFVHDGHLYAFGGQKAGIGPFFIELWRLNLTTMGAWEQLPSFPHTRQSFPLYSGHRMAFNAKDNKAYLFLGTLIMPYFNVATNKWGRVKTTFPGTWPWSDDAKNNVMHCIDGMLYVFGGTHDASPVGTDLLMVLDIEKKEWKLLKGEGVAKHPDFFSPGPREHACSWVGKGGKKIYVMYGDADRMAAKLAKKEHASGTTYEYDDLWCYDIAANKWTKMRIFGNAPCRRTEMSCVYNPVLDKVIVFGGYTPRVPTMSLETREFFQFSYYADTFMLDSDDPAVSSWKHVLTRGFPIYRAQAHLFVDERTGKTYMFSGYTNSQFVPGQKQLVSRSFADVWELRLDMEGGFFDTVDIEEEARIARAGPFQRCFACGSAGLWKKCGGSCKGKVYFCNQQCLKDEWRTHKALHNCRKV